MDWGLREERSAEEQAADEVEVTAVRALAVRGADVRPGHEVAEEHAELDSAGDLVLLAPGGGGPVDVVPAEAGTDGIVLLVLIEIPEHARFDSPRERWVRADRRTAVAADLDVSAGARPDDEQCGADRADRLGGADDPTQEVEIGSELVESGVLLVVALGLDGDELFDLDLPGREVLDDRLELGHHLGLARVDHLLDLGPADEVGGEVGLEGLERRDARGYRLEVGDRREPGAESCDRAGARRELLEGALPLGGRELVRVGRRDLSGLDIDEHVLEAGRSAGGESVAAGNRRTLAACGEALLRAFRREAGPGGPGFVAEDPAHSLAALRPPAPRGGGAARVGLGLGGLGRALPGVRRGGDGRRGRSRFDRVDHDRADQDGQRDRHEPPGDGVVCHRLVSSSALALCRYGLDVECPASELSLVPHPAGAGRYFAPGGATDSGISSAGNRKLIIFK